PVPLAIKPIATPPTVSTKSGGGGGKSRGSERTRVLQGKVDWKGPARPPLTEQARKAQLWLTDQFIREFGESSVEGSVRDHLGRESDIQLLLGSSEVHIEVKHMTNIPGSVFWTDLEVSKARDLDGAGIPYFIAIMTGDTEVGYAIFWEFNPLEGMQLLRREIQWWGETGYFPVECKGWEITRPEIAVFNGRHHRFRIRIKPDYLASLKSDDGTLKSFREWISSKSSG
ncbi:MAG: hypothetical protein ACREIQ_06585, partial [Nitrospiria bacterium]